MAYQLVINLVIALIWILLQNSYTAVDLLIGYAIGFFALLILRRFLPTKFYGKRLWAVFKLVALFLKELIIANIDVIKIVLSPKLTNQPGIIAVPTKLKTNTEISLLAALITLTPGTLSMDFSKDSRIIYVHALHVDNKEKLIKQIQDSFEQAILEVTQP